MPGLVETDGKIAFCDVLPALTGWPAQAALQAFCKKIAIINDVQAALLEESAHWSADTDGGMGLAATIHLFNPYRWDGVHVIVFVNL